MPASTLDPVKADLRTALRKNESTNTQLPGSTKKAFLSKIEFEPAATYQNTLLNKLKSKYIVLKSVEIPQPSKPEEDTGMGANETLKLAKSELYPLEAVQLGWKNCNWSVGAGMVNMGNTCYLNSTLQALFHVPAFVNWLMSDKDHTAKCQDSGGLCIICAMRKTLQDSQQHNASAIRPLLIYNKLKVICRNLGSERQEDAPEFLRYLVEAMEKAYLNRFKNNCEFDPKTKETTPLNQILGGYLRSAVRCLKCGHVSTTFQNFQDLLLDIRKAQTLDEAIELYFSREKLEDESYRCDSCQKKVPATTEFSLERAPMVLCIQLKRFSVTNHKISKHISFRQKLDLTKYARYRPNVPLIYRLVALVTHIGPTVGCGHYIAIAQAPSGNFYHFDDSTVRPISLQTVFNTNAYIMLYELESAPFAQKTLPSELKFTTHNTKQTQPTASFHNSSPKNILRFTNGLQLPSDCSVQTTSSTINGCAINGNSTKTYSLSSNDSDSDSDSVILLTEFQNSRCSSPNTEEQLNSVAICNKPTLLSNNNNTTLTKLHSSSFISTSLSIAIHDSTKKKLYHNNSTSTTSTEIKLVSYDSDGTSNSEDSNQSAHEIDSRVSTKAAVGEWEISSTRKIDLEPCSAAGKNWERKKTLQNDNGTLSELFKMSHNGCSAPVSTWNGTRAYLEKEINIERREQRKRTFMDNSDEGRVKHQKFNTGYKSNPGYNPIEEFHNSKNWSSNKGPSNYKQFYNRYRRNFHHKNFHKSFRYRQ